jgi:hypothetical protein
MKYQASTVAPYWIKRYVLQRKGLTEPHLYKLDEVDLTPKRTLADEIAADKKIEATNGTNVTNRARKEIV